MNEKGSGAPAAGSPELIDGKLYRFDHKRKGCFTGRVVLHGDDVADVEITDGEAKMVSAAGNAQEGEVIRIRLSLATWEPVS